MTNMATVMHSMQQDTIAAHRSMMQMAYAMGRARLQLPPGVPYAMGGVPAASTPVVPEGPYTDEEEEEAEEEGPPRRMRRKIKDPKKKEDK